MRIEVKGLIAALITGLGVLGATFGVAALLVHAQPPREKPRIQKAGMPAPVVNPALVAQGHTLYTQSCASCHGANAEGSFGPSLHNEDMSNAKITQTIRNGVPGKMPAFGKYNDAQIQTLVAYIRSLK